MVVLGQFGAVVLVPRLLAPGMEAARPGRAPARPNARGPHFCASSHRGAAEPGRGCTFMNSVASSQGAFPNFGWKSPAFWTPNLNELCAFGYKKPMCAARATA